MADFVLLNESGRTQVLAVTVEARAAVQTARFVTGIRDRLQRYLTQGYPAQLALASRLAAPAPQPPGKPGEKTPPPTPPVHYTSASSLRAAAQAELKKGNRISL